MPVYDSAGPALALWAGLPADGGVRNLSHLRTPGIILLDEAISASSGANLAYTFTAIAFAVAMAWESLAPRRALSSNLLWRWLNNFSLGALSWYASAVGGAWFILWLSDWTRLREWGLLRELDVGPAVAFLALLVTTQFFSYWVHRAFHRLPWLWLFHLVHHVDVDVDVSTSYRHHPLEPLLTLPVMVPAVFLLGAPMSAIVAYQLFDIAATIFSHSNVRLPRGLEKYLRWLILTPDFHRTHHCAERRYTDSNFGSLVPWFDYLFGTARFRPYDDQETMQLGLEYLRGARDSRLDRLLWTPVIRARAGNSESP